MPFHQSHLISDQTLDIGQFEVIAGDSLHTQYLLQTTVCPHLQLDEESVSDGETCHACRVCYSPGQAGVHGGEAHEPKLNVWTSRGETASCTVCACRDAALQASCGSEIRTRWMVD